MSRDPAEMTEAELAEWQYANRNELDAEEGEPVEVSVSPQLSVTMSFRLPGSEADAIREAARTAGMSLSEWIRQALASAAASPEEDEPVRELDLEAELAEAERQLDATTEALRNIKRRVRAGTKSELDQLTGKTASAQSTWKKPGVKTAKQATTARKAGKKAAEKRTPKKGTAKKRSDE